MPPESTHDSTPVQPRWLVMKFGGTSVSSAMLWREIRSRINAALADGYHVLVVVSAIRGVTDALQRFVDAADPALADETLGFIRERHELLWQELGSPPEAREQKFFEQLESLLGGDPGTLEDPRTQAQILGMGEMLSSAAGESILAALETSACWQDARSLLRCEEQDRLGERTRYLSARCRHAVDRRLSARLAAQGRVHITQGFVASNEAGETVLLGRGGSDTSATCLGAILQAERVEIWTDVPGLFTANPQRIPGARLLRHVSYREAQELASMGARVLHPRCIEPLRAAEIPLQVMQTSRPEINGTLISPQARDYGAQVKAILHRQNITLVIMEGMRMWQQVGFLADVFAIFKRHGLSIDLVSTSESNVTVSLDLNEHLLDEAVMTAVERELGSLCRVRVEHGCASVSLVGLGIRTILHRLGPALEVFEQRPIFLVSQAANDLNLTFVVEERHAEKLVQQLHQILIPGGVGGDSVFGETWEQLFYDQRPATLQRAPWWKDLRAELLDALGNRDAAYIYHLDTLRAAAGRLTKLKQVDRIWYSVKANSHPEILRAAAGAGLGFECVSIHEVRRVRETVAGIDASRILFTPNFAPRDEYREAARQGVYLTIDNLFVLEQWGEDFAGRDIILRIDPGSGLGHHKMVRTTGTHSKFGIPPLDLARTAELVDEHDISVVGFHAHTGSGIMHPDAWERTLHVLSEFLPRFPGVRQVDIGGGLGVPDKQDELPLDLEALDRGIGRIRKTIDRDLEVWLEPGRYLVAQCGVLLLRVTQTKGKGEVRYVGVASGMNSLIRPALYGGYHEIYNLSRLDEAPAGVFNVVGPICETADVLGLDRVLPECRSGDVLLVDNTGAYGAVMASRYNLREPAEELVLG